MDSKAILKKLAVGQPLFLGHPKQVVVRRIMGFESEFGIVNNDAGEPDVNYHGLPMVTRNGGEIYRDCDHIEWASPEVSNPASLVAYYQAGKILCQDAQYSPLLFCNNNDWKNNTFGAHESYFTCASKKVALQLIPFLIARTVMCGSGWLSPEGWFEISQRARHIKQAIGMNTTSDRALINTRDHYPIADVPGWDRFHFICGDANMMESSTFLRFGTMSLVLGLLERGVMPHITYDVSKVEKDMREIAGMTRDWYLLGVKRGPRSAIEILDLYLQLAKRYFANRDPVTDAVLVMWEDTLHGLSSDLMRLRRRLDWVAKLHLFELFQTAEGKGAQPERLRDIDLQYHSLDREEGLYYYLQKTGQVERVVSDQFITYAIHQPPSDTRAFIRGKLVQHLQQMGGHLSVVFESWKQITVIDAEVCKTEDGRRSLRVPLRKYSDHLIGDPHVSYRRLLRRIMREVSGHHTPQGNYYGGDAKI